MRRVAAAAVLAVLAGCATAPGPNCARLAFDGWFCPLPPAALAPRNGTDLVTVTRNGKSTHYVGQLSVTADALTLALSNLAGVPLATITWDGRSARVHPEKSGLKPKLMTALLEFTLVPPPRLRSALHGLSLDSRSGGGGTERRLRAGDKLIARALVRRDSTRIEVPRAQLSIVLRPLPETDP